MAKFNENRTYGVEIEFVGSDRQTVAAAIRANGINCYAQGYNHTTQAHWKVITDASCGYEIVSPVLKGREGLRQLKIVCETLNEVGATVNKKCGLHVHHDINDYQIDDMKSLFSTYLKLEQAIDQLLPVSRRANNNQYCRSLQGHNILGKLKELKEATSIEELRRVYGTRYMKLNFESYIKYGTVEFRQHSGTIEYEKIYNWILFTQHMVENAKGRTVQVSYTERWNTLHLVTCVLGLTKANGADEEYINMWKWFRKRAKALAA